MRSRCTTSLQHEVSADISHQRDPVSVDKQVTGLSVCWPHYMHKLRDCSCSFAARFGPEGSARSGCLLRAAQSFDYALEVRHRLYRQGRPAGIEPDADGAGSIGI